MSLRSHKFVRPLCISTIVRLSTKYGPELTLTGVNLVKMFVHIDQILQNFKLGYANAIKPVYRAILNYTLRITSHHENLGPSYGSDRQSFAGFTLRKTG